MSNSYILVADGIGGNLLAVQAAAFMKAKWASPTILCPSRNEIFRPFHYLISDQFKCVQVSENSVDLLLAHGKGKIVKEDDELYLIYPDGLHRNPYSFDFQKYNTNPVSLNTIRILTHKYKPLKGHIYVNLSTSTEGYLYPSIKELVKSIAKKLPEKTIHLSYITKWAGKDTGILFSQSQFPENVLIYQNDDIINQIEIMSQCEYGIFTDNGFSHISYHFGQNRLLIDPRFGYGRESLMWRARWRQTDNDSVKFDSSPEDIADLVSINLKIPQTTLLPKQIVLNNKYNDWSRELLFKF